MEEKIEIWQVGNTGLRNPNRIQDGFRVFANSPYVGNLRKENDGFYIGSDFVKVLDNGDIKLNKNKVSIKDILYIN